MYIVILKAGCVLKQLLAADRLQAGHAAKSHLQIVAHLQPDFPNLKYFSKTDYADRSHLQAGAPPCQACLIGHMARYL